MSIEHFDSASELLQRAKSSLAGARVLVVDAGATTRREMATIFKKVAAQVRDVADGGQAVYALHQAHESGEPIQLVVMDLALPRLAGVDVLELIRKDSVFASIAVIVLAAAKDVQGQQRCAGLDAAVLVKPQMPQQILDAAVAALAVPAEAEQAEAAGDDSSQELTATAGGAAGLSSLGLPLRFGGFAERGVCAVRPGYLRCPFCKTIFTAPRLVDRALREDPEDRCAVGLYKGPLDKPFMEYLLVETVVCPGCVFAHDRTGFDRFAGGSKLDFEQVAAASESKWEGSFIPIGVTLRKALAEQTDRRLKTARQAGDNGLALFRLSLDDPTIPRSHADALVSFDLALDCVAAMVKYCTEEAAARVRQKGVGFLLKRAHCHHLLAESKKGTDAEATWRAQSIAEKRKAFALLATIKAVEFRVLEERLVYLARTFFLADELLEHTADDNTRETLEAHRKQAWMGMRAAQLEQQKARNGRGTSTVRRFLDPVDSRMYTIRKGSRQ